MRVKRIGHQLAENQDRQGINLRKSITNRRGKSGEAWLDGPLDSAGESEKYCKPRRGHPQGAIPLK